MATKATPTIGEKEISDSYWGTRRTCQFANWAMPFSGIENVDDSLAVLCGVASGGLRASIVNLAQSKVFDAPKK